MWINKSSEEVRVMKTYESYDYKPVVEFVDYNENGYRYVRPIEMEEVAEWSKIVDENGGEPDSMYWSVYAHHEDGYCDVIADCPDQSTAEAIAKSLNDSLFNHEDVHYAVAAIMDELNDRTPEDGALKELIAHREDVGAADWRQAIVNFAVTTEKYLQGLSDDEREEFYSVITWDFEWLGEVIDSVFNNVRTDWWEASVEDVAAASKHSYESQLSQFV